MSVKQLIAGKHSCVGQFGAKRLSTASTTGFDEEIHLERDAMLVYCGKFNSMDGEVEITEQHIDRLIRSHNERRAKLYAKLVSENNDDHAVTRAMPPIQLDHSTSAVHTVGRVVGQLFKAPFVNEDGIEVQALMCDAVRILGKDNMEKVRDGRWCNLSIGADLEGGTLNELSITPFPAAPNATLLKEEEARRLSKRGDLIKTYDYRGHTVEIRKDDDTAGRIAYWVWIDERSVAPTFNSESEAKQFAQSSIDKKSKFSEGVPMHEKMKKHLMEKHQMSDQDADDMAKKMSKHLKEKMLMDDEKAEKHMAALTDDDAKKLMDDVKEEEKKLSEAAEAGKAKMAAAKANVVKLTKDFRKGMTDARLAAKKVELTAKISKLRASGKVTPAEQKKIDFAALAAMGDKELTAVLKSYEDREPVIDAKIHGTTRAVNLAKLKKDHEAARLEAETRQDLGHPLTDEQKVRLKSEASVVMPEGAGSEDRMKLLEHLLRDHPAKDAVMSHVKEMMGQYNPVGEVQASAEQDHQQMSALAENVNRLQTQFQDLIALIGEVSGIESAELTE